MEIPTAGAALQALLDVHGGSVDGAWEIGWALAPQDGNSQLQGLGAGAPPSRAIVVRTNFALGRKRRKVLGWHTNFFGICTIRNAQLLRFESLNFC